MPVRKFIVTAVLAALILPLHAAPSLAGQRVALVVGNGGYAAENIPALANPVNDAKSMARALEASGFEVRLVTDADQAAMRAAIEAFGERLEQADGDAVGLFYYAGHGVEVRGRNYLIPIGAEIERAVEFKTDAVPAEWVLSWMEEAGNRLNMVILDACRNNPFGKQRGASQGLAQMDAPSGTLIAYSAAPGQVAVDGEGENSPYTAALAQALVEPGLRVEDVFKRVRVKVEAATNARQTPWESSSLRGDFYFVAKAEEPRPVSTVLPTTAVGKDKTDEGRTAAEKIATERVFWESVKDSKDRVDIQAYLTQFPDGTFKVLANNRLKRLSASTAKATTESVEASLGLNRRERRLIQSGLAALKFDAGPTDGMFGQKTRAALQAWQSANGEAATGWLTRAEADILKVAGEKARLAVARDRAETERKELERTRLKQAEAQKKAQLARDWPLGKIFSDCWECPTLEVQMGDNGKRTAVSNKITFAEWDVYCRVHECSLAGLELSGMQIYISYQEMKSFRGNQKQMRITREYMEKFEIEPISLNYKGQQEYLGWLSRRTGNIYRPDIEGIYFRVNRELE